MVGGEGGGEEICKGTKEMNCPYTQKAKKQYHEEFPEQEIKGKQRGS